MVKLGEQGGVRKRPTRTIKRNRRICNPDTKAESPRKQPKSTPIKLEVPPKTAKEIAQSNGLRLRNLLKLPKGHKWVCYEWFYSTLDQYVTSVTYLFVWFLAFLLIYLQYYTSLYSKYYKVRSRIDSLSTMSVAYILLEFFLTATSTWP